MSAEPSSSSRPGAAGAPEGDIELEKLRLLYRNTGYAQLISTAGGLLLVYLLGGFSPPAWAIGWWLLALLVAVSRFAMARRFEALNPRPTEAGHWQRVATFGALATGLVWAAGGIGFMIADPGTTRLFTALVFAGLVGGAVPVLSPLPSAFRAYTLPVLLSIVLAAIFDRHTANDLILACLTVFYFLALLSSGHRFHAMLDNSIRAAREARFNAERLETSESRYRAAFNTTPDAVNINRLSDGMYLDVNQGFLDLTGWTREEVLGKTSIELDLWADPADRALLVSRLGEKSICRDFEARFRRKDGAELWGLMSASVVEFDGTPCILSVTRDMTERWRAEEALRASQQRFSAAFRVSPLAASIASAEEGRFLEVNENYTRDFGWTQADLVGKSALDIGIWVEPDDRTEWVARLRQEGRVVNWESSWRHKNGQSRRVAISASLTDVNAEQCILAYVADITETRAAEEQLRKLSLAVEQSPNPIVITDDAGRVEYVNAAFTTTTGYRPDEIFGQPAAMLDSGWTAPETTAEMWATLRRGEAWKGEFINRRKDGSEYFELNRISPVRQRDGRISHYLAIKEDITERKRVVAELDRYRNHLEDLVTERTRQLDDALKVAESASHAKSVFLANMSHEIRTPMNAITGMAYLLRREGVTPRQAERLDKIEHAVEHLLGVINDVLDLSKIEAGKLTLESAPVAVEQVVAGVAEMLAPKAQMKGLRLLVESEALPRNLLGDTIRLTQAVLNLASNAVKFTERGTVTVKTERMSEDTDSVLLRFSVRDTGIGVAPEAMQKLFRPFEQADNSTTRQYGGTGLGLVIARRLAELMGGQAGAESVAGEGSTFWFTARLRKDGAGAGGASGSPRPETAETELIARCYGRRILIVEDDFINREVAIELLGQVGLLTDIAVNGVEAVEKAAADAHDLILMDMQMPEMDGIEATLRIRALPDGGRIPIVAMTANAFAEDRRRCLEAGMNDFITKPIDPDLLFTTLLRWLSPE